MARVIVLDKRPKEWGPLGTMIVINNLQRMFEHEAEKPVDDQAQVAHSEKVTPSSPKPTAADPATTTDTGKAK